MQITDAEFKPLANELNTVVTQKQSFSNKLSGILDKCIKFVKINLTKLSQAQIDDDVGFIHGNITEASAVADAREFLSIAMQGIDFNYGLVDGLCLSLVGEIESSSTHAQSLFQAAELSRQSSWCVVQ